MSDVFISYARRNEADAIRITEALRAQGFSVWRDDALPAHRPFAEVIEERLKGAKAVIVLWSADALKSEWVRAEADLARRRRTLVQATLDGTAPPLPFNQIQVANLRDWRADGHAGWAKVLATLAELLGRPDTPDAAAPILADRTPERIRIPVELRPIVTASGRDPKGLALALNSELAQAMASLPGLRVHSGVHSGGHSGGEPPAFVVEGALQRAGDQLRLTMSLRSCPEHGLEWSQHYDGAMGELFAFQERAAGSIAANVDTIVRAREIERALTLPEDRLNERQLYYRAIGNLRKMERQSLREGARCAERVIERAPDHAHAMGMAAVLYLNMWMAGVGDGEASRLKASEWASRALRNSEDDHWVAGTTALVLAWTGHPIEVSVAQLDRICAQAPTFAPGWFWGGVTRIRAGDLATAIAQLGRAIALEPLTTMRCNMTGYLGAARVIAGDFAAALPLLAETVRVRPEWTSLHVFLAIALGHLGRPEEARRALESAASIAPVLNGRWPTRDAAQRDLLIQGLAKAGLAGGETIFADL